MKKVLLFCLVSVLIVLSTGCFGTGEESSTKEIDDPVEAAVYYYYDSLQKENYDEALSYLASDYLTYLNISERDYVNIFKDMRTLEDWRIEEISVRSIDEIDDDITVPFALEPLLVTSGDNYIVIVDISISIHGETSGVVDNVLVAEDNNGEWKIFGIVSF
ncbi:hypothetical protein [Evansella cellulosilytica]|uniref:DUF4829 domain-containing protein n=1 Tax=Evansella cellulosilytica (strain ATCC 21833 / DSM 2522 / FERM P-1141 / JCM 9156 / N-4) TaxID=649639 RepID=E6TXH6_EVAC2|nr:hypothetical protein [Evansella cellulosilytica]ADU28790.1 hypothetical protein Bcell_0508 [Evansella cellulosilytica DSM 2522]